MVHQRIHCLVCFYDGWVDHVESDAVGLVKIIRQNSFNGRFQPILFVFAALFLEVFRQFTPFLVVNGSSVLFPDLVDFFDIFLCQIGMGTGGMLMHRAEFVFGVVLQGEQHLDTVGSHQAVDLVQQPDVFHIDGVDFLQSAATLAEADQADSADDNHQKRHEGYTAHYSRLDLHAHTPQLNCFTRIVYPGPEEPGAASDK